LFQLLKEENWSLKEERKQKLSHFLPEEKYKRQDRFGENKIRVISKIIIEDITGHIRTL
jgi:hypothetical protein